VKSLHPPRALWLVLAWIVLIVAGVALHALSTLISSQDLALVRDLAGQRTGLLTALAHAFSLLGRSYVLVPCAIVIAAGAVRLGRPLYGVVMIVSVVGAEILQNVDKVIIGRSRPAVSHLEHVSGPSFPSGHATDSSAFFVLLLLALLVTSCPGRVKLLAAFLAVVIVVGVAVSRVYLGVHYPTDVGAGILLGASWSLTTATVMLRGRVDREPA
jgi:undecaprenyl-diphosphatase